ncbi:MAG: decarboxylating NADP(+)-dependent phosphogluconate dehydrogenase [Bacteroidales bacterium]|nr:decarboxylating NADP(+)-dependent phosphogluconate dehydrogenase [Bacteroidales bacterium]
MKELSDIGLIGLGVMGRSLALNMENKGFQVSVYNYIPEVTTAFMKECGEGKDICDTYSYTSLAASLKAPRKLFLMVTAGAAVDQVLDELLPVLHKGDIIIDGGNSHFQDTARRAKRVEEAGLLYVGTGVSGGEEGALKGPSMMPGGSPAAWPEVKPIFKKISAKAPDGTPCCDWIGPGGSGHFVKMVHNGIEYGDIQLICECYQIMRDGLGLGNDEMHDIFADWNRTELDSYLIGITADILSKKDDDGHYILDLILDTAGQKGTGKWTVEAALDLGVPLPMIGEAVFARCVSALREERVAAAQILSGPPPDSPDTRESTGHLREALLAAKIISYAQGFSLLNAAASEYSWPLDYGRIAGLWRGGCIIRSVFLDRIKEAYDRNPKLDNIMLDKYFSAILNSAQGSLRAVVSQAALRGIPVPALSSALSYYDSFRCQRLGANLLQAQRDLFGAHTYERIDRPRGEFFHSLW